MKIINLKKFIRGVVLIFLIIFGISLFITHSSYSYNSKKYISIYVAKGDTLWSIATDLKNTNYYKEKDIRYIISDIKEINNLKNSNISDGDKLLVPTI